MRKCMSILLSLAVCIALMAGTASHGFVSAKTDPLTGIRWFPVPENRQYDDAWFVECDKEGCLCQRFDETVEDTGKANFLDTVYDEDGSLTITRNGNDRTSGIYWPRIRTDVLVTNPAFDLETANTVYFDFTATPGTTWNVMLSINGMNIKLSKTISDAVGVHGVANSDADGTAGTYKGSFNYQEALTEIAAESGTESSVNATALKQIKKTFVPQLSIFCVGEVGASMTIRELYISTAEDKTGEKCTFVDMGLLSGLGDEFYGPSEEPAILRGDVNFNGYVDTDDAISVFYHINKRHTLTDYALHIADENGDGTVNLFDAVRIFYLANELPV